MRLRRDHDDVEREHFRDGEVDWPEPAPEPRREPSHGDEMPDERDGPFSGIVDIWRRPS